MATAMPRISIFYQIEWCDCSKQHENHVDRCTHEVLPRSFSSGYGNDVFVIDVEGGVGCCCDDGFLFFEEIVEGWVPYLERWWG
jgi:hypothetical protein